MIGDDGRMTEEAGERSPGSPPPRRRRRSSTALREEGRLRAEEPYAHSVPFSHRSGERIEPLISLQWFCRMDELAQPAIEVVERDEVRIAPAQWKRVYLDWMREIRPWCISRQLWWGHRIPVWYCDACEETIVAEEPPERCGACGGELRQEEDVLDTWFSSALWPFATLGWPDDTPELRAFYPTSFLTTAREILFLWVARMVMTGIEFAGDVPFRDVYVHSVIQARDGRRMSKSLGTGIDPLEEIDVHGADALRFGLLAMSSTQDVRFSDAKVQQGRDLANKLWNASRLILLNAAEVEPAPRPVARRGPLDPLAAGADDRLGHREARGLRLRPRRAGGLLVLLARALRLVPGDRQAAALRRRGGGLGDPALRARADAGAAAPDRCRSSPRRSGPTTRPRAATSSCTRSRRPTSRCFDDAAEAEVEGGIELTQRLRAWRDLVEVPAASVLAGADRGRRRRPSFVARLARFEFDGDGGEPVASVGPVRVLASEELDADGGRRAARGAARGAAGRGRAGRAQARQRGVRRQGPGRGGRGGAREARALPRPSSRSWLSSTPTRYLDSLEPIGWRLGLERMHRLTTALGLPQHRFASIHVVGTNGKSSVTRMTAALLEAHGVAHRRLRLAPRRPLVGADADRRRGDRGGGVRRRGRAGRAGGRGRQPQPRGGRGGDPVRGGDRGRLRRPGLRPGRGGGDRGRPRRPARRDQHDPLARSPC